MQNRQNDQQADLLEAYKNSSYFANLNQKIKNGEELSIEEQLVYAIATQNAKLQEELKQSLTPKVEVFDTSTLGTLEVLPNELIMHILLHLPRHDFCSLALTSKILHDIVKAFILKSSPENIFAECVNDPLNFPARFRTTPRFLELVNKLKTPNAQITAQQAIIYALTSDDVTGLDHNLLDKAIDVYAEKITEIENSVEFKSENKSLINHHHLMSDMVRSLKITSQVIKHNQISECGNNISKNKKNFRVELQDEIAEKQALEFINNYANQFLQQYFAADGKLKAKIESTLVDLKVDVIDERENNKIYSTLSKIKQYILFKELIDLIKNIENRFSKQFYCNLSGAYLFDVNLSNLHIIGFNFTNTDLDYSRFDDAVIERSNFTNAELHFVHMVNTKIPSSLFQFFMHHEKFYGCNMIVRSEVQSGRILLYPGESRTICDQFAKQLKNKNYGVFIAKNFVTFAKKLTSQKQESTGNINEFFVSCITDIRKSAIFSVENNSKMFSTSGREILDLYASELSTKYKWLLKITPW